MPVRPVKIIEPEVITKNYPREYSISMTQEKWDELNRVLDVTKEWNKKVTEWKESVLDKELKELYHDVKFSGTLRTFNKPNENLVGGEKISPRNFLSLEVLFIIFGAEIKTYYFSGYENFADLEEVIITDLEKYVAK